MKIFPVSILFSLVFLCLQGLTTYSLIAQVEDFSKGYRNLTWGVHLRTVIDSLHKRNITGDTDDTPVIWKSQGHSRIQIETTEQEQIYGYKVTAVYTWTFLDSLFHCFKVNWKLTPAIVFSMWKESLYKDIVARYGEGSNVDYNTVSWETQGLIIGFYHKITLMQDSYGIVNLAAVPAKNLDLEKQIEDHLDDNSQLTSKVPRIFENIIYNDGFRRMKWGYSFDSAPTKLGGETITSMKQLKATSEQNSKRTYKEIVTTQIIDDVQFEFTYSFVSGKFYKVTIRSEGQKVLSKSAALAIIDKLNSQYGPATDYYFSTSMTAKMWENEKVNIELGYQDEYSYVGQTFPKTFTLKIFSIKLNALTKLK